MKSKFLFGYFLNGDAIDYLVTDPAKDIREGDIVCNKALPKKTWGELVKTQTFKAIQVGKFDSQTVGITIIEVADGKINYKQKKLNKVDLYKIIRGK